MTSLGVESSCGEINKHRLSAKLQEPTLGRYVPRQPQGRLVSCLVKQDTDKVLTLEIQGLGNLERDLCCRIALHPSSQMGEGVFLSLLARVLGKSAQVHSKSP